MMLSKKWPYVTCHLEVIYTTNQTSFWEPLLLDAVVNLSVNLLSFLSRNSALDEQDKYATP